MCISYNNIGFVGFFIHLCCGINPKIQLNNNYTGTTTTTTLYIY